MDREVINDEITSGEAGWICTRLDEEGPWSDLRRECCRVRFGIGGGVVKPSMMTPDYQVLRLNRNLSVSRNLPAD